MNTRACSRYSSTILMATTGARNFLFCENIQKIPRIINFIATPALAASYNLKINSSSEREFIFNVMDAGFLLLANFISLLIIFNSSLRRKVGQGTNVLHAFRGELRSFHFSR